MSKKFLSYSLVLATTVLPNVAFAVDSTPAKTEPQTTTPHTQLISIGEPSLDKISSQQLNAHIIANYTGRKYRLGPNDVLSVSVYDSPEFSQTELLVQPDGNITLAPFGSINVAGVTIDALQKDLTERLKFYLNNPQVTVKLDRTKPFQVYVAGAVLRPGPYEMLTDINRNQMVSSTTPGLVLERRLPLLSNVLVALHPHSQQRF
ncbi:MAG: Capsule polysaccharide export protein, partial [Vampirovibrio sp.]|nr:Capsule polysaccharide export protein [Vampirovibrio sp.]